MADYLLAASIDQTFTDTQGQPLVAGTVSFFIDTQRTTPKAVFKQKGSPGAYTYVRQDFNGVVTLDAGGKIEGALYYYPYDADGNLELYYVIVKDSVGQQIETREGWPSAHTHSGPGPTPGGPDTTKLTKNIITNGQFSFNSVNPAEQAATFNSATYVAAGWSFDSDAPSYPAVVFDNIQSENLAGSPALAIRITTTKVDSTQKKHNLVQNLGTVNIYEGDTLTFSMNAKNMAASGTVQTIVNLVRHYDSSDADDTIQIGEFDVTTTRSNYTKQITLPAITKSIGGGSYLRLELVVGLGVTSDVEYTNMLLLEGAVSSPVYPEIPEMIDRAEGFAYIQGDPRSSYPSGGETTITAENYAPYNNLAVGDNNDIEYVNHTGEIILASKNSKRNDFLACDGSTLKISGNNGYVDYRRLYSVIGDDFGATVSGDITAKASGATVTVDESNTGPWTDPPAIGTMGSTATIVDVQPYGVLGVHASVNAQNTVTFTYQAAFAPDQIAHVITDGSSGDAPLQNQSIVGQYIPAAPIAPVNPYTPGNPTGDALGEFFFPAMSKVPTTVAAGPSPVAQCTIDMNYLTDTSLTEAMLENMIQTRSVDYLAFNPNDRIVGKTCPTTMTSYMTFPAGPTPNTRENLNVYGSSQSLGNVNYLTFSFNGSKGTLPALSNAGKTVNYDWNSSESVNTNLNGMCNALNTPYHWGITFNSTPAAGTYFEYNTSTTGQEFYVWFKVDGAGTDPAPTGRTGIQVNIGTGASVDAVASAVATALDAKSFSLPAAADLPAIPAAAQTYLEYKITL